MWCRFARRMMGMQEAEGRASADTPLRLQMTTHCAQRASQLAPPVHTAFMLWCEAEAS